MAAKIIAYAPSEKHSTFIVDDFSGEDLNLLGQKPGEYGKNDLANYKFRFGDLCIDIATGGSHWLGSEGWV